MEPLIAPIDKDLLLAELSPDKVIRKTNKDNNVIYSVTNTDSPNVMKEIGRLRELSYRSVGSGTGKSADIDALDIAERPYHQLIVWDPEEKEILGGYRYKFGSEAMPGPDGKIGLGTIRLFRYSEKFIQEYLPVLIELGRSFVQPDFQSSKKETRSLFVLDNLWDGLGALMVEHPEVKYFLGQVSLFVPYQPLARDLILYFLKTFFPDPDQLVTAINPVGFNHPEEEIRSYFSGTSIQENYQILSREVRKLNERIPPLINTYINTSSSMRTFGTVLNPFFLNMEDTGLMISISDIYEKKKERHIQTYKQNKSSRRLSPLA